MSAGSHGPLFVRETGLALRFGVTLCLSIGLMVLDDRYHAMDFVRSAAVSVIHPVQSALAWPFEKLAGISDFFVRHQILKTENQQLRQQIGHLQADLHTLQSLRLENTQLRALQHLTPPPERQVLIAEVVAAPVDPLARHLTLNRGSQAGVVPGAAVVDAAGLMGQITRVHPLSSEVTLVVSRQSMLSVESGRTGLRLLAQGMGSDNLVELPWLDAHSDVLAGDVLVTSGLDGVYPKGIPVARVLQVRRPAPGSPFARAWCAPVAESGVNHPVRILLPLKSAEGS